MADLKPLARRIFHETLAAIDIPLTMQRKLVREGSLLHCDKATIDLSQFKKVSVVAIGKAAHAMLDGLKAMFAAGFFLCGHCFGPGCSGKSASRHSIFHWRTSDSQ